MLHFTESIIQEAVIKRILTTELMLYPEKEVTQADFLYITVKNGLISGNGDGKINFS